jgi:oligopeptidase B
MKNFFIILILSTLSTIKAQNIVPAPKKETILKNHSITRSDDYFWMNQRDSKEVLDYIGQENKHSEDYFKKTENIQNILLQEFENRIDPNDQSAPFFMNKRQFVSKNQEGKDYEIIYLIDNKKEIIFFDENERANKKSYYGLGDWSPSSNNKLLAFSEDFIGRRKYTISFRDEKNQKILKDQIKDTDGSIVWANDNKTIFYVKKDPQTLREFQVYSHVLGEDASKDKLVYEEKDERFSVFTSKSLTDKYVMIHAQSSTSNEIRLIDANSPTETAKLFLERKANHLYNVDDHENGFYVTSNENAKNNKVLLFSKIPSSIAEGKEIIGHDSKILIESLIVFRNYLVIQTRTNGLQEIEIIDFASNVKNKIQMKENTYSLSLGQNDDYDASNIYYHYSSMTTPSTVFSYDLVSNTSSIFFEKKMIDPLFKSENYQTERIWAIANDGTKIPISLVYKKGVELSKAPLLLYGYGSYGVTIPAGFSATRISLLDRGFVFAIAHVRGGKYLGEEWYENGKFLKKKNTFTDFINAAEYLSRNGYCDSEKIYAQGGSAGGLLMGAIANMAPYLWKGVIAQVPFVDVVNTMLDESIPLTVGEYEEWGNPNEKEFFDYMLSYSPYDNVKKMDYPALLITTGYHDSQVQYWEPLKWIAKLRDYRTNDHVLLFDCNMDAGHGGGSGRSSERIEVAKMYAFILDLEGIEK